MPKKILFAVSDKDFLTRAEGFFQRQDFELVLARDSREAFALIEEQGPDLAFLALDLPPWGGDACCRRIKKDFLLQKTRVVLLVPPAEEDSERSRDTGADAILAFPAEWSLLIDTARGLLRLPDPGRLAPRASVAMSVRFRHLPHGDELIGKTANLSTGGVFLATDCLYPRDSRLEMQLEIDPVAGRSMVLVGRVAWTNHPEWVLKPNLPIGMGIEFLDLALNEMVALENFVNRNFIHPSTSAES